MEEILKKLADLVGRGKVDQNFPYPPDLKGEPGVVEYTRKALDAGIPARQILSDGLMIGMKNVGDRFGRGEAFIPDLMISAKAMTAATDLLKPYFDAGNVQPQGEFIIGTVAGDLHDIGKNIVKMILEGAGWKVIDLGNNVSTERFLKAVDSHPGAVVGMSALLTTTMENMEKTVRTLKEKYPGQIIVIGGAPITEDFRKRIGADAYFPSPHELPDYLKEVLRVAEQRPKR